MTRPRITWAPLIALAVLGVSCGQRPWTVPLHRVGVPDSAGLEALDAVVEGCRPLIKSIGRFQIRGSANGDRIQARFSFAIIMNTAARLESIEDSNPPRLVFWTLDAHKASVWLPKANVVVSQREASELLQAVLGLPLSGSDLERFLVCPTGGEISLEGVLRLGDGWLRIVGSGPDGLVDTYMRATPRQQPQLTMIRRAPSGEGWRADFLDRRDGIWSRVRLRSLDWAGRLSQAYDVELRTEVLEPNPLIERQALTPVVPAAARGTDLDELRRLNPFRGVGGGG